MGLNSAEGSVVGHRPPFTPLGSACYQAVVRPRNSECSENLANRKAFQSWPADSCGPGTHVLQGPRSDHLSTPPRPGELLMDHHALLRSLHVNLPGRPVSVVSAFQGSKATPRSLPLRHLFSHTAPKGHCVRIGEGTWVYCPLTFCSTSAARGDQP